MHITRFLEEKIKKYIADKEIIAILGTRQCGKTTLMKRIYSNLDNAEFISFEDRDMLEMFRNDIKLFVEKYVKNNDFLFIDEFQYAKAGGKQLKFIYDNYDVKIFISGSSAAELSIQSLKYLVGRIFVFYLYTLSFGEFLRFKDEDVYKLYIKEHYGSETVKKVNEYYNEFVIYGGYPRVVLEDDIEKKTIVLKNIYNTYLLREIKEILQINEDEKINKMLKSLSLQLGGVVNITELANVVGVSVRKVNEYIDVLKKTFILLDVKPFFRNKRKELVKASKIYFYDMGFRNIAINNFSEMRVDKGELNENFAASEIAKKGLDVNYWRTKAGAEVDFVVDGIPVEVKTSRPRMTRSFRNFLGEYKPRKGFILSMDKVGQEDGILFRPIAYLDRYV